MKRTTRLFCNTLLASVLLSGSALADWSVQNDQSSVHFISTKKEHISEIHHFKQLTGSLDHDGQFELSIDLTSVETGIEIRNSRMQEHLFNVAKFPTATISTRLPIKVMQLKVGKSIQSKVSANLHLMGKSHPLALNIQITKTQEGGFVASSIQPVLVSAKTLGIQPGLDILQKLANLPSIGSSVPVSFNLVLNAD